MQITLIVIAKIKYNKAKIRNQLYYNIIGQSQKVKILVIVIVIHYNNYMELLLNTYNL